MEDGILNLQKSLDIKKFEHEPLVSIIIPTRDGIEHLKRLLNDEFTKNMCYKNYEVIIVDNASKDDTLEFIESLSSKINIKLIN